MEVQLEETLQQNVERSCYSVLAPAAFWCQGSSKDSHYFKISTVKVQSFQTVRMFQCLSKIIFENWTNVGASYIFLWPYINIFSLFILKNFN